MEIVERTLDPATWEQGDLDFSPFTNLIGQNSVSFLNELNWAKTFAGLGLGPPVEEDPVEEENSENSEKSEKSENSEDSEVSEVPEISEDLENSVISEV